MHFSMILLHLAGATFLLLFAVRMVRQGMESAYGPTLRSLIGEARGGNVKAAAGGAALAIMLQSSTAVAMLACSFASSGLLTAATGIALRLGAELGSAIVVRVLSFDLEWLVPVCLSVGGFMYLKLSGNKSRNIGRMVLGIGFVLLSLQLLGIATAPMRNSTLLPKLVGYLSDDYVTAFLIGAVFTWLIHSSVAAILLIGAFATKGLLPLDVGISFVLGANLGGGLIAFGLSRGMSPEAQRSPLGNLILRTVGTILALALIEGFALPVERLGSNEGSALINLHVAFNAIMLAVALPFVGVVGRWTEKLIPASKEDKSGDLAQGRISALDRAVIDVPRLALASATRELLRMGELVEVMVRPVMDLLQNGSPAEIKKVKDIDEAVNDAHTDIKLYLAEVNRGEMSSDEARRSIELTDFAINLEHAGDVVAKNLLLLAEERAEKNWRFSPEGWAELTALHERVVENMHLALNVLVSQDLPSARQLVAEKEHMRDLARHTHTQHLKRLQSGTPESIETSGMHIEIARGLKEINSLLVTIAYPILQRSGDLLDSRLAKADA